MNPLGPPAGDIAENVQICEESTSDGNRSSLALRLWVLTRLALINSIGYAGSTIVPLWVGDIGAHMDMPAWFGGVVATAQLFAAALFNLMTPFLFRTAAPAQLAKVALPLAAGAYLFTLSETPFLFVLASLIGGACLGVVLNATNRIVAASAEVQKGYSIFLISEGVFSSSMFYSGALLSQRFGLTVIFLTLPAVTLLGTILMLSLPTTQLAAGSSLGRAAYGRIGIYPILGLIALLVFFSGQSCMMASALALGRAAGISAQTASATVAVGVIIGLLGAIASRLLGERFGVRWPILCATATLALMVFAMTQFGGPMMFYVGVPWLQLTTFFVVPYFFTMLARLDTTGRMASIGPAFLIAGVAVGPSLAASVTAVWGVAMLGPVASLALFCSALLTRAAAPGYRRRSA